MSIRSILRIVSRKSFLRALTGCTTILFLGLILLGGCKKRQVTVPTPLMNADPQYWVRVLLLNDTNNCTLQIPSAFNIENADPNQQTQALSTHIYQHDEQTRIQLSNGAFFLAGKTFECRQIIISTGSPHIFSLNGNDYRGKLKLIIGPDGNSFDAINLIPLEPYLAGVIGAEMPDYWEPEALKAQVIAARTYCLYIKRRFGPKRNWDVSKTAAHQVYLGVSSESAAIWNAVHQTEGMVLTCKQNNGKEDIFPAYYSSTCGGHTESSRNVFGDSFEPLIGVPCPFCKNVAKPKFFFWPMVQIEKDYITNKLFQRYEKISLLGEIKDIAVAGQSNYEDFSRLTRIEVLGSSGKKENLRAEDFRLTIDPTGNKIKSACFVLIDLGDSWAFTSGRGWGHGVGMCQCGAQGMARKSKTAKQILSHYYPGSKISTIDY
ncbi:MAG: SpoIID/LytB domain-containing protein [Sedimentisphaerales bacterium]|nr:SpoIID/LytB domain-containing protein [Sedimentisphaerales bacterium]